MKDDLVGGKPGGLAGLLVDDHVLAGRGDQRHPGDAGPIGAALLVIEGLYTLAAPGLRLVVGVGHPLPEAPLGKEQQLIGGGRLAHPEDAVVQVEGHALHAAGDPAHGRHLIGMEADAHAGFGDHQHIGGNVQ